MAYPPGLLPSGSWSKILGGLNNHNDEEVMVELAAMKVIAQYLDANAADKSQSKKAARILRSLNGQTPLRITQVPYIRRKHHDIDTETFKRKSVGSFSNCAACHTTAGEGIFDDDTVRIPSAGGPVEEDD